jgi:hypothetical protein
MATKEATLLICRESFVGEFAENDIYYGVKGKTILDPDTPEGKKVLKNWAKFFEPISPTNASLAAKVG